MRELYLMPIVGDGRSSKTARRPKYSREIEAEPGHSWSMQELPDGRALVRVEASSQMHATLHSLADVEPYSALETQLRAAIAQGHEERAEIDMRESPIYIGGEAI